MDRNPIHRAIKWYKKENPTVIATYIKIGKDLAFDKVLEYQTIHELLIKIVKETINKYPSEVARQHEYVWYAQGIWYSITKFSGKARQIMIDAHYTYYRFLGLNDGALREIAQRLGVKISDMSNIWGRLGLTEEVIYKGVKKALAETLNDVAVNPTITNIEYDPSTGLPVKITVLDKITGKTKTYTITYDEYGNPIKVEETT